MSDCLTKIPTSKYPELRDLFSVDFPKHANAFAFISTLIEIPRDNVDLVTLNGYWGDEGLFLALTSSTEYLSVFPYTKKDNSQRLKRALKLIQFNRNVLFGSIADNIIPVLEDVLQELELKPIMKMACDLTFMSCENALRIWYSIPNDVIIRQLTPEDAFVVNEANTLRSSRSSADLLSSITTNYCIGVCDKNTKELMGWCLTGNQRDHMALEVKPEFKGRGLGTIMASKLAHDRALQGMWSLAIIKTDDEISLRIFRKLGFKRIGGAHYWKIKGKSE